MAEVMEMLRGGWVVRRRVVHCHIIEWAMTCLLRVH